MGEVGTKWNWNCERCGCWNIRDEVGLHYMSEMRQGSFKIPERLMSREGR
jgi:hypothetical protein